MLAQFHLDMNIGDLTLIFSETVNASSVDPTGITLQQSFNSITSETAHNLAGGKLFSQVNDISVTLIIDTDDLNVIKANDIARHNLTTWLTLSDTTIQDMSTSPQYNVPLISGMNAASVYTYISDTTSPRLLNFTLNLTAETLVLTFDETIDAFSVNTTYITLQNTSSEPMNNMSFYTLTGVSSARAVHSPIITIDIGDEDLNEIKRHVYLGTIVSNTFISFTEDSGTDRAGNPVEAVLMNSSLPAMNVIEDSLRPELLDFEFDLNQGIILLKFSETVLVDSVILTDISLLSDMVFSEANGTIEYNITSGKIISMDDPTILISLSQFDLNEIKRLPELASGNNNASVNTFISIRSTAVTDINGNSVFETPRSSAREASQFTSDITTPNLLGFRLDLNSGLVTLTFTEAVNETSFNPTGISFLSNNSANYSQSYSLTNGSVVLVNQTYLVFEIVKIDLDNIKANLDLAMNENNTYITLEESTVLDTSGNPVEEILSDMAIKVADVPVADAIQPQLTGFDLDIDNSTLLLRFSETVLASSVDPSAITLQYRNIAPMNASILYSLTSSDNISYITNTEILVRLANSDLNEIKSRPLLAVSNSSTFISITDAAIKDASGNNVVEIPRTNALPVTSYTEDSSPPELVSFSVDLNRGEITFRFSETVNTTTLDITTFTLQDSCPTSVILDDSSNNSNASNATTASGFTAYNLTGN